MFVGLLVCVFVAVTHFNTISGKVCLLSYNYWRTLIRNTMLCCITCNACIMYMLYQYGCIPHPIHGYRGIHTCCVYRVLYM